MADIEHEIMREDKRSLEGDDGALRVRKHSATGTVPLSPPPVQEIPSSGQDTDPRIPHQHEAGPPIASLNPPRAEAVLEEHDGLEQSPHSGHQSMKDDQGGPESPQIGEMRCGAMIKISSAKDCVEDAHHSKDTTSSSHSQPAVLESSSSSSRLSDHCQPNEISAEPPLAEIPPQIPKIELTTPCLPQGPHAQSSEPLSDDNALNKPSMTIRGTWKQFPRRHHGKLTAELSPCWKWVSETISQLEDFVLETQEALKQTELMCAISQDAIIAGQSRNQCRMDLTGCDLQVPVSNKDSNTESLQSSSRALPLILPEGLVLSDERSSRGSGSASDQGDADGEMPINGPSSELRPVNGLSQIEHVPQGGNHSPSLTPEVPNEGFKDYEVGVEGGLQTLLMGIALNQSTNSAKPLDT